MAYQVELDEYGRVGEYPLPGNSPGPAFLQAFLRCEKAHKYQGGYRSVSVGFPTKWVWGPMRRRRRDAEADAARMVREAREHEA